MLLELLSDFQISIPELGRIEARTHPVVLLTSNNSRELTEALKRRCLYLWLDYPTPEHELEIVRLHAPELPETVARRLVEVIAHGARARPQEAAVDRGVDRLGARAAAARRRRHRRRTCSASTMSIIVKHRTDLDIGGRARRRQARRRAGVTPRHARDPATSREALRAEGVAIGTSELNDAFAALERGRRGPSRSPFREALAATLAKSPEDRRVFDLVFERFFFRAAEGEALRQGVREATADAAEDGITGGERIDLDNLREQVAAGDPRRRRGGDARPRAAGDRRVRAPRRGLRRARRRRAADPPRARPALRAGGPPQRRTARGREPLTRDQIRRFEQHLRRELERAQIERTQALPPSRPLNELDRALPSGPLQDLAAVHRVVAQLKRRLATQGHETRGRKRHAHVDVRRTMRASLQTGGVPVVLKYRPRRPRRPELYVLCDVSTSVTSGVGVLPVACCTPCTTRSARCARSCSSSGSPRSPTSSSASALQGGVRGDLARTPASPTSPATPTTAASGASSSRWSRTTCTRARP